MGAAVSLIIGVLWGAVAGYLGGRWDNVLMRIVDVLYSLPSIIFVIVLITTLEARSSNGWRTVNSPELDQTACAVVAVLCRPGRGFVADMARIVRGQVLSLRTRAFVEASRTLGARHGHILFRHILPNVFGVVIVYLTLTVPAIILYESFLSYLGLGYPAADGQLGFADCRRRGADQHDQNLLVAAGVSRRVAGHDAAGAEFSRRWFARCLGRARRPIGAHPLRQKTLAHAGKESLYILHVAQWFIRVFTHW